MLIHIFMCWIFALLYFCPVPHAVPVGILGAALSPIQEFCQIAQTVMIGIICAVANAVFVSIGFFGIGTASFFLLIG